MPGAPGSPALPPTSSSEKKPKLTAATWAVVISLECRLLCMATGPPQELPGVGVHWTGMSSRSRAPQPSAVDVIVDCDAVAMLRVQMEPSAATALRHSRPSVPGLLRGVCLSGWQSHIAVVQPSIRGIAPSHPSSQTSTQTTLPRAVVGSLQLLESADLDVAVVPASSESNARHPSALPAGSGKTWRGGRMSSPSP